MATVSFKCKVCGNTKPLRDMWILREPKGKPEKLCCRTCFDKHIAKI